MSMRAEKEGSGRKWAARGTLMVVILACGLLLAKCGDKPESVLSGAGGAALPQENVPGEQLAPRGVEQSKAEAVMVQEEKEKQPGLSASLPESGTAYEKALSQPDASGGAEVEQALGQAGQLDPGDKGTESLAQMPTEQPAEISPLQQQMKREDLPGELQAVLKDDDKEATIPNEEEGAMCSGAPTAEGLATEAEVPPGKTFTDPVTRMPFVLVKGGCFNMGSNSGDSDEKPVHEVCVDDFYLGEYEVTQAQYEWIMGHNPSSFKGCDLPVESVSWEDAQAFIRKLNQASGKNYRLPSEAEWEYAARSGWKDEATASVDPMLQEYACYIKNLGNQPSSVKRRPNGLGLYDMNCNVWEWVSDWYGAKYYASSPRTNPQGPLTGSRRVIRAGNDSRREPRFAKRFGASPDESYDYFGFRVAFQSKLLANGLQESQKPENSTSAEPTFQGDVSVLKAESASEPAPGQPFL